MTTARFLQPDWGDLNTWAARVVELGLHIQAIPAPTFAEAERAAFVASAFAQAGLREIDSDALHNVYGVLPGKGPGALMISAHTDTVFGADVTLTPKHLPNGMIAGPGLGDNSIAVAALIAVAEFLQARAITPPCDLVFVATTREEGMGDLGGMKAAFAKFQGRVQGVINVEGLALGHVYNAGIAVRRLRISAAASGGHSWLHFGQASAIHHLVTLGAHIAAIRPTPQPRTTYNIGLIEGGQSVNSIAASASMLLDMRSETAASLASLEREVRRLASMVQTHGCTFNIEVVGDRPAGAIPPENPLVRAALNTLASLGISGALEAGSTDGNVPLALGCPTITIGITRGGNAHRTDEFIETAPIGLGLRQLIHLTLVGCDLITAGALPSGG